MKQREFNDPMENRIVKEAKQCFIERGYVGTTMSLIADRVGINRPVLHYYFRTKDRLFNAVFEPIMSSLMLRIPEILSDERLNVREKIDGVVGLYYSLFSENPDLPLFVMREMQRDPQFLLGALMDIGFADYVETAKHCMENAVAKGEIRDVPLRFLFMNIYSLIVMPFVMKGVAATLLTEEGETYDQLLAKWRPYIVEQTWNMVKPS